MISKVPFKPKPFYKSFFLASMAMPPVIHVPSNLRKLTVHRGNPALTRWLPSAGLNFPFDVLVSDAFTIKYLL